MTDQLLGILKLALLALLYLFFARVLWAVWTEVRGTGQPLVPQGSVPPQPAPAKAVTTGGKRARRQKIRKAPTGQVARLLVVEPSARKGATLGVDREITFGRAAGCTVSVPDDAYMSQVHARVYMDDGDVFVEDLNSTNGTFINGEQVHGTRQLFHGDRLQVGHTVLEAD
jgi:pSer/pThr/pTyr-binding forkhead associated (FHA) protein